MYNREANFQCGRMSHGHQESWKEFRKHFGDNIPDKMKGRFYGGMGRKRPGSRKSVNIIETGDSYILNLYAAGLKKELFGITVDDDILTIRYQPGADNDEVKFIYREYRPVGFERAFKLSDKVLKEHIEANYIDGVLEVTLPKDPEAHKPGQVIEIK